MPRRVNRRISGGLTTFASIAAHICGHIGCDWQSEPEDRSSQGQQRVTGRRDASRRFPFAAPAIKLSWYRTVYHAFRCPRRHGRDPADRAPRLAAAGGSQEEFADICGLDRTYIGGIGAETETCRLISTRSEPSNCQLAIERLGYVYELTTSQVAYSIDGAV